MEEGDVVVDGQDLSLTVPFRLPLPFPLFLLSLPVFPSLPLPSFLASLLPFPSLLPSLSLSHPVDQLLQSLTSIRDREGPDPNPFGRGSGRAVGGPLRSE